MTAYAYIVYIYIYVQVIYTIYVEISDKKQQQQRQVEVTRRTFLWFYAFSSRGWKVIVHSIKIVGVSHFVITTLLTILITLGISAGQIFPPYSASSGVKFGFGWAGQISVKIRWGSHPPHP